MKSKKIYFVDEDIKKLRAFVVELQFLGFDCEILTNADEALEVLGGSEDESIALVILDVMLAVRSDEKFSNYSALRTGNFHRTGLCLLEDLVSKNSFLFPAKAIFLTHASSEVLISAVKETSARFGVPFLRKRDFSTAYDFGQKIKEILKETI